jgi:hypothetical protein
VQRFGSSLAVNVHWHVLALDGVYVTEGPGRTPTFLTAPILTDIEVARVFHDARQRIERVLRVRGLLREPGDEPAPVKGAEDSLLPYLQAASVQSKVAAGENAGRSSPRLVDSSAVHSDCNRLELPPGALKVERDGYSLHAATRIEVGRRADLEHLLRYMARPALCQGRLILRDDGKVIWNLRKPWRDGTRAFVFDPLVFIERLAALIPHPREHQLTYHAFRAGDAAGPWHRRRPCAITSYRCRRRLVSAPRALLEPTRNSPSRAEVITLGPSSWNECSARVS